MSALFHQRPVTKQALRILAAALCLPAAIPALAQTTSQPPNPTYSAQSIVNGATQTVEALAPNVIATLYGTNLAFSTDAVAPTDIVGGMLPTSLAGVGVWVNSIPCSLLLVSPTQINFLIPYELTPGAVSLLVARQGVAGPGVSIQLNAASPGLFVWNVNNAIAEHLSGQLISAAAPAVGGEIIVIYAAGLGRTAPDATAGQLAAIAAPIVNKSGFQVLLNGTPLPPGSVLYAGLTPGFAGLYQINLQLPQTLPVNPQIQLSLDSQTSPGGILLITQ